MRERRRVEPSRAIAGGGGDVVSKMVLYIYFDSLLRVVLVAVAFFFVLLFLPLFGRCLCCGLWVARRQEINSLQFNE